jgi:hypothetical protein
MSTNAIAIFSPITTRCLEVVAAYLDEIHEPTAIYALAGKRLIQSIEPFTHERPITLEVVSANQRDILDWQNTIQYMVYQSKKLVFFIPPGTRVIRRKTADKQQSWASRYAVELCRPIERIYVEDTPVAHGKYYRISAAPAAIQLQLPLFEQFPKSAPPPLPMVRPTTSIPYLTPPRLTAPKWWKRNQLPAQNQRWIETNLYQPIEQALKTKGYTILSHNADKTHPLTTATVHAEMNGIGLTAAFILPGAINTTLTTLRQKTRESSRLMLCTCRALSQEEMPTLLNQEELTVFSFPPELLTIVKEYEDWINFPTKCTINGSRYYHPGEYTTTWGPNKQWELKHMHPLITAQFEAQKLRYARQVPLGNYYADFIINDETFTQIVECKRHPFQHNLRDGIEQLLLYKALYRRLFPTRSKREIKLVLVLPNGTITPLVTEIAGEHQVEIRPLDCDALQTDMITKKHLASKVDKLRQQILKGSGQTQTDVPA